MMPTQTPSSPTDPSAESGPRSTSLFRDEALQQYQQRQSDSHVLRISPRWTDATYRVLCACLLALLLYAIFSHKTEYASGPAVIRRVDPVELTALLPGSVDAVEVIPGQRVRMGDILLRFHAESEESELRELRSRFDLELVQLLRDPESASARNALSNLRTEIARGEARLEQRLLRSPVDGSVQDILVRPGQHTQAGHRLLSLSSGKARHELIAFLPGRYRPLLRPGLPLRLKVSGFSHAYVDLEVSEVAEEVVGPTAVRRFLGTEVADAVPLTGPVFVIRATLADNAFRSDGDEHSFYGGMQGTADVGVRRRSLLVTLIPGLDKAVEKFRG